MTDSEILQEIEKRIREHLNIPGWSEEGAGFQVILNWLEEMRTI